MEEEDVSIYGGCNTVIETKRLVLEPLVREHAVKLYPSLGDPRLYTFIPRDPPQSFEEVEKRFARLEIRFSPDRPELWLNWAARHRVTNDYTGLFEATVRSSGVAYVAYFVFVKSWRQGYAREGLRAVIEHLFVAHNIVSIQADIDTRNRASIALVEHLGFMRVAYTKNADWFKGGSSDEFQYLLTRDDFLSSDKSHPQ